ncbi:hypothetical protein SAMN05443661_11140 [Natronobacterium gregoryi]|uniref:Uncharacterized protein n=2 Tax=Natronobacterium gregoryi TaxID=44930 RepID=L0AJR1_NATGS|nr:hypothetical protein Natgr_2511 [Natronobacterium gregoryi SP2]SFJ00750.1 hypothetical protein SAMN05443661_11140 [Natronobacterium gregoryi]
MWTVQTTDRIITAARRVIGTMWWFRPTSAYALSLEDAFELSIGA